MTKKILKILSLAAVGTVFSSFSAFAVIISGMDGGNFIDPVPTSPISDAPAAPSVVSNYNDMDALFGFRVLSGTGAGFEGIIDLGSVTQFNHTFTLSLGDLGGFMTNNFGSDWYTRMTSSQVGRTDIQWAVVATDNSTNFTNDLWSTRDPSVRSTPWPRNFNQSETSNAIAAVGGQYSGQTVATGTTSAVKQSASNPNSWTSYQPGGSNSSGISFKGFNPTNEGNTNTALAFDYIQTATGTGQVGTQLGTFTWNADGSLTFTVVPEPDTYKLMGLGALGLCGLIILRRRRAAHA